MYIEEIKNREREFTIALNENELLVLESALSTASAKNIMDRFSSNGRSVSKFDIPVILNDLHLYMHRFIKRNNL